MKRLFELLVLLTSGLFLSACSGKIHVVNINDITEKDDLAGVYYALPQTVVTVDVSITKTDKIRGPYYMYANKYLGLGNVVTGNSASYEICRIDIGSYVEPDPLHYYMIKPPRKALRKRNLLINLSESGLIKSINEKTISADIGNNEYSFSENEASITSETFNYLVDANIFERIDTVIEMIHLDTITIERHTLRSSFVEKDMEQKAKEVAEYIIKIKEKKFELLSGFTEIPYERATIEYMYEQLDKLENEYLLLFTGISISKTNTFRFVYLPKKEEVEQPIHLFNFSESEGILDQLRQDGDEFVLEIKNKATTNPLSMLFGNRENKKNGIFYRIPEYGTVSLICNNKVEAEASLIINQFGVVHSIEPSNLQLQFYPNSGAINSVGIER
ncbi:MAG: DUF4831 family protein [Bacteroidales bacterium]|nr:DUF4831 family protein [Bacteroidales bacterium]